VRRKTENGRMRTRKREVEEVEIKEKDSVNSFPSFPPSLPPSLLFFSFPSLPPFRSLHSYPTV
jgi:hypothetical protein